MAEGESISSLSFFPMKDVGVLFPIALKLCVAQERPLLIIRQYSCKMKRFPISELNKNTQLKDCGSCLGSEPHPVKLQQAAVQSV